MPALTSIIMAIGVAASVASVGMSVMAGQKQEKITELDKQNNATRQQQMNLDAMRKKRDVIRQAQVASAQSEATAGAQGAQDSSGAQGALGAISGQAGVNTLGINQNQEAGNKIFANDAARGDALMSASAWNGASSGLSSLGGLMTKNAGTIAKVGNYAFG